MKYGDHGTHYGDYGDDLIFFMKFDRSLNFDGDFLL